MRVRRTLAALGLGITSVLATQVPANAATEVTAAATCAGGSWDHTMYTNDDNPGGRVQFQEYCDVVRVCDLQADGYSVLLLVTDYSSGTFKYEYRVISGSGTCQQFDANMAGPYNLAEGHVIQFDLYLKDGNDAARFHDQAFWLNDN